jgi:hypothetical protein
VRAFSMEMDNVILLIPDQPSNFRNLPYIQFITDDQRKGLQLKLSALLEQSPVRMS